MTANEQQSQNYYDLAKLHYKVQRPIMVIEIPGHPKTKKNHGRIVRNKKRVKFLPSKQYVAYAEIAVEYLQITYGYPEIKDDLNLAAKYYLENKRGKPDLINLIQATQDILEAAGIVFNDCQFKGLNGSEIVGYDKDNPRVEIFLSLYSHN
jgi:Holliday junction resolvase RusA-like endonuclease